MYYLFSNPLLLLTNLPTLLAVSSLGGQTTGVDLISLFHALLGLLAQATYDLTPHKEGLKNFKNLKKYVIQGNCLSFKFIFRCFIKKMPFCTSNKWFSRPNPKILGHLAQCRIVNNPLSVWE
jgi:hypothetical protein